MIYFKNWKLNIVKILMAQNFLSALTSLFVSSSVLINSSTNNNGGIFSVLNNLNTPAESRQNPQIAFPKYKYYTNKKGTQVIEIGPSNICQIFEGQNADFIRNSKKELMRELNFIQFRLMMGKCHIENFINKKIFNQQSQESKEDLVRITDKNYEIINNFIETKDKNISEPINSHEFELIKNTNSSEEANNLSNTTDESPRLPLIFPGTKWCGAGSVAKNHDDIGIYVETDKCCREHDLCEDNMEGKECKHGLCNDSDYTRSHCDCDEKFRICLQKDKSFSSLASFKIANLYFNILKPLCFAQRPPVKWCRRHRITGECIEFEFDPEFRSEWQFFPAQPYLTESVEKFIQPALPNPPQNPDPIIPPIDIFIPHPEEEEEEEEEFEIDEGRKFETHSFKF